MKKVGEHVTLDFLGVKQDYSPKFYNKVIEIQTHYYYFHYYYHLL